MKMITVFMMAACMQVCARTTAQNISLSVRNEPLINLFRDIQKQSGYQFFFNLRMIDEAHPVTLEVKNRPLQEVLELCFKDQPLTYAIVEKTVVVKDKEKPREPDIWTEAIAPPADIHGRVVDSLGNPLAGANILLKGTKKGTATDANGMFVLKGISGDVTLIVSFTGYGTKEYSVHGQTNLTIVLARSESPLDEFKVTAYGQTTDRTSISNVTTVNAKTIEKQPVSNVLTALEGRVPGLFIQQVTGNPGSGVNIQIQGKNSIGNGNDPFYVVDGVPYTSQMLPNLGPLIVDRGSPFSYINPQDIESITVLKDADATSIYGSRAANGAILITTKKGRKGDTRVDLNVQNGWGKITRHLKLLNTQQYLEMRHEALNNDGVAPDPNSDYDLLLWDTTRYTDWQKVLIGGTSIYKDYNISVSGGSERVQYRIGSDFHRETDVYPGNFADTKGSLHFTLTSQSANKKFQAELQGTYLHDNNQLPNNDLTTQALTTAPDAPALYNPDGTLNWAATPSGDLTWTNPLYLTSGQFYIKVDNLISHVLLSYELLPGLQIKTSLGYTNMQDNGLLTFPLKDIWPGGLTTAQRSAQYSINNINSWSIEPQAVYNHRFDKDVLNLVTGATITQRNSNGLREVGNGYTSDLLLSDIRSAASISVNSSDAEIYKYSGVFAQLTNNWDGKYLLDATIRRDGSSRFGPASQFHNFWSVGGGWIFTDENFAAQNIPWLSFGKLRGSYGSTGNDQIGDYTFMSLYNPVSFSIPYQNVTPLQPLGLSNPNLQWEENRKLSVGVDLGFVKDRVILKADYFRNRSSNQLLFTSLPGLTGFTGIEQNFPATVQNTGLEITLKTANIKSANFSWETNFNLTVARNKLIRFDNLANSSSANYLVIGQSINVVYVNNFAGVNPTTGVYQFFDSKGKLTSTPDKPTVLLNNDPSYFGGLDNTLRYKRCELSFLLTITKELGQGNSFGYGLIPGRRRENEPAFVMKRWQKPGDQTSIQRFNSNYSIESQYYYAVASTGNYGHITYVRLKNISLSYSMPENLIKKAGLKSFRLYANGENLLTFTKYSGLDPESQGGLFFLPPLRVLTFGIQASF